MDLHAPYVPDPKDFSFQQAAQYPQTVFRRKCQRDESGYMKYPEDPLERRRSLEEAGFVEVAAYDIMSHITPNVQFYVNDLVFWGTRSSLMYDVETCDENDQAAKDRVMKKHGFHMIELYIITGYSMFFLKIKQNFSFFVVFFFSLFC